MLALSLVTIYCVISHYISDTRLLMKSCLCVLSLHLPADMDIAIVACIILLFQTQSVLALIITTHCAYPSYYNLICMFFGTI